MTVRDVNLFAEANTQKFARQGQMLKRHITIDGFSTESKLRIERGQASGLSGWWHSYLAGRRPTSLNPQARELRTLDLFAGAGGLALGLRQATDECGFIARSIAAVDEDLGALEVYRQNHETSLILNDSVSMLVNFQLSGAGDDATFFGRPSVAPKLAHLIGSLDVVLAGPPCQGHSNFNNHSRRDDHRNDLYLTVPAMAVALEIPMVIIENVPGVIHDHRSVVNSTISLFQKSGYRVTFGVHDAAALGWPQTRKRFFLIASRDVMPIEVGTVASALAAESTHPVTWALNCTATIHGDSFMDELPAISPENQRRVNFLFDNELHELPNSERPECHREGTTYKSVYGRMWADQPAPTLTAGFLSPGRGRFTHPTEPRALKPREAARVQGFPNNYVFGLANGAPPRTHLAKWIGNAVPMPLGFAAALSLLLPRVTHTEQVSRR
jgi:DNA (cytosine-5)-methyltransferase 1